MQRRYLELMQGLSVMGTDNPRWIYDKRLHYTELIYKDSLPSLDKKGLLRPEREKYTTH